MGADAWPEAVPPGRAELVPCKSQCVRVTQPYRTAQRGRGRYAWTSGHRPSVARADRPQGRPLPAVDDDPVSARLGTGPVKIIWTASAAMKAAMGAVLAQTILK